MIKNRVGLGSVTPTNLNSPTNAVKHTMNHFSLLENLLGSELMFSGDVGWGLA